MDVAGIEPGIYCWPLCLRCERHCDRETQWSLSPPPFRGKQARQVVFINITHPVVPECTLRAFYSGRYKCVYTWQHFAPLSLRPPAHSEAEREKNLYQQTHTYRRKIMKPARRRMQIFVVVLCKLKYFSLCFFFPLLQSRSRVLYILSSHYQYLLCFLPLRHILLVTSAHATGRYLLTWRYWNPLKLINY